MAKRKEKGLLHRADSRQRRRLFLIAYAAGAAALLIILAGWFLFAPPPEEPVKLEIYKLLLQFSLITAGGGALLALVGDARERGGRRQDRAAAIQSLDRELDRAYRELKRTKRRFRAHLAKADGPELEAVAPGAPAALRIPREIFEKGMDDLLKAQLELETICEHIRQRDDILDADRLKRMRRPLRYATRYYHDVHEDFETGRVRADGKGDYIVPPASNVADYLRSRRTPPEGRPEALARALERLELDKDFDQRSAALVEILRLSPLEAAEPEPGAKRGRLRFADVAAACFDLLSAELADARQALLS